MATVAELEAELAVLEERRRTTAGIESTAFGDQSTRFDQEGLNKRIAAIQQQIASLNGGTRTRVAAFSKGV